MLDSDQVYSVITYNMVDTPMSKGAKLLPKPIIVCQLDVIGGYYSEYGKAADSPLLSSAVETQWAIAFLQKKYIFKFYGNT